MKELRCAEKKKKVTILDMHGQFPESSSWNKILLYTTFYQTGYILSLTNRKVSTTLVLINWEPEKCI